MPIVDFDECVSDDTLNLYGHALLQEIKKEEWSQFAQEFADWLRSNEEIIKLHLLQYKDLNAERIALLIPAINASNINHLNISAYPNCAIEDAGAEKIAEISKLTYLDISKNNLTAEGAKKIAQLQNLETLFIDGNKIGDEGAKAISQMKSL